MSKKTKQKEQTKTTTTNIKYSGEVSIKVKKGNKVLSSYKSHNDGKEKLFNFLANALAGYFSKNSRPCKLKLFKLDPDHTEGANADLPTNPYFTSEAGMSSYIMYNTTPAIKEITTGTGNNMVVTGYSVTYHFVIPSAYIETGSNAIYKLAIYPDEIDSISNMCATFLFVDNEDQTKWKPQKIESISKNIVLFIDWKMTVGNKIDE